MTQDSQLAEALRDTLISVNEEDRNLESANVVDGLFAIARALKSIAHELKYLGNGDAATPMGALEAHSKHMGEAIDGLTSAVSEIAQGLNTNGS